jgi:hypothetical protein
MESTNVIIDAWNWSDLIKRMVEPEGSRHAIDANSRGCRPHVIGSKDGKERGESSEEGAFLEACNPSL